MIIDNTQPKFKNFPDSLNGEVLLMQTENGFITASIETVKSMKGKTDSELSEAGWLEYKDIIVEI